MLISFLQDVIIIQLIKVVLVVPLLSIIVKKPMENDQVYGQGHSSHEMDDKLISYPPRGKELRKVRSMNALGNKLRYLLVEFTIFTLFLFLLMIACYGNRGSKRCQLSQIYLSSFQSNFLACVVFHRTNFVWTKDHDILFCRELLVTEPYVHKVGSIERAKAGEQIASNLNSIQAPKFRVTTRSVRDRYTHLTTRKAEQLREEEKASGIEATPTELDMLLEEIFEKENAAKAEIESALDTKKRKAEQDKASADSIRRLAMERTDVSD